MPDPFDTMTGTALLLEKQLATLRIAIERQRVAVLSNNGLAMLLFCRRASLQSVHCGGRLTRFGTTRCVTFACCQLVSQRFSKRLGRGTNERRIRFQKFQHGKRQRDAGLGEARRWCRWRIAGSL